MGEQLVAGGHAVVVGGGIAGLLSARVLTDHFDRVTVLERDGLGTGPGPRPGVPQGRHIHALFAVGQRLIERFLPGFVAEMITLGGVPFSSSNDAAWLTPAGWAIRVPSRLRSIGATRDLFEWVIRDRLGNPPGLTIRDRAAVSGLMLADGRAAGVRFTSRDTGRAEELAADLVIDASGRRSRAADWLQDAGLHPPATTVIDGHVGYASRFVQPPAVSGFNWTALYVQTAPPNRRRGGAISPVEGGRWMVTLIGGGRDYPPTDEDGFRAFAGSLPAPEFAAALDAAGPLTPVVGHRSTENRWQHFETMPSHLDGLLVLGDAACAFNPVYGQGMSTAAIGAKVLDDTLRRHRSTTGLTGRFQRRLAAANRYPWELSALQDYRYAEVDGPPQGWKTRLRQRYVDRVIDLATRSPTIRLRLMEVLHMVRPPTALLDPGVMARVLGATVLGVLRREY